MTYHFKVKDYFDCGHEFASGSRWPDLLLWAATLGRESCPEMLLSSLSMTISGSIGCWLTVMWISLILVRNCTSIGSVV
ncbi:hypothetical protein E4T43_06445 [Aureobasidium subglaciale]|nr:hypothetical protein E4T43_06445 [Aureobasidium subglaciale]